MPARTTIAALALLSVLALAISPASASTGTGADHHTGTGRHPAGDCPDQIITNPEPSPSAYFGKSVAIDDGELLIGAPTNRFEVAGPGAAYLFSARGKLRRTLTNPTPADRDEFGWSVALGNNRAAVSAPTDDTNATDDGMVYIFNADSGRLTRTLANPSPGAGDEFGRAVATDGRFVVVGAPGDDNGGSEFSGAVYLFDLHRGRLLQTLLNPNPTDHAGFGVAVAIDDGKVLVGAAGLGATQDGAAHLYDARTGRLLQAFLNPRPPAPGTSANFGLGVALDDHLALIGARGDRNGDEDLSGAAHLFDTRRGDLVRTILNPTPAAVEFFGHAVALSGGTAVIGAPLDRDGGNASGAFHVVDLRRGEVAQIVLGTPGEGLGDAVALSRGTAVVGAPENDTGGVASGAVHVLRSGC